MGDWSIGNHTNHLPTETWQSFVTCKLFAWVLLGNLAVGLCYPLLDKLYLFTSKIYKHDLNANQRTVVIQHTIEAIVLSIMFVPYTYTILPVHFQEQSLEELADNVGVIMIFMAIVITMYLMELAVRFSNLRALVVIHHMIAYLEGILAAFRLTTANVKPISILVYFISFEALTFVGLVLYRLAPTHQCTRPTILAGMIVFAVSRPIQLVWVIGSLVSVGFENLVLWQAILQICLTAVFTLLQLYTLTIHYSIYQKARGVAQKEAVVKHFDIEENQESTDHSQEFSQEFSQDDEEETALRTETGKVNLANAED